MAQSQNNIPCFCRALFTGAGPRVLSHGGRGVPPGAGSREAGLLGTLSGGPAARVGSVPQSASGGRPQPWSHSADAAAAAAALSSDKAFLGCEFGGIIPG